MVGIFMELIKVELEQISGKPYNNKIFLKRNVKSAENAAKYPGSFETEVQIPPEIRHLKINQHLHSAVFL